MVEEGTRAAVHLVVRLADDETVLETTDVDTAMSADTYDPHRDYRPAEVVVGAGELAPAIDDALREMEPGESRTVVVEPDDAFGEWHEEAVIEVDRDRLEGRSDTDAEPGQFVLSVEGDAGWVTAVGDDLVTVDFNHELAGERLAFEVRLVDTHDPDDTRPDDEDHGDGESVDDEDDSGDSDGHVDGNGEEEA